MISAPDLQASPVADQPQETRPSVGNGHSSEGFLRGQAMRQRDVDTKCPQCGKGHRGFQKRINRLCAERGTLQSKNARLLEANSQLLAEIKTKDVDIQALEQALLRLDNLISAYERGNNQ